MFAVPRGVCESANIDSVFEQAQGYYQGNGVEGIVVAPCAPGDLPLLEYKPADSSRDGSKSRKGNTAPEGASYWKLKAA